MTKVPPDAPEGSPDSWLKFASTLFEGSRDTWFTTSWVPWIRYSLSVLVVVAAVITLAAGLAIVFG